MRLSEIFYAYNCKRREDWMLSAETLVKAAPSLALKKGRTLDDYYVAGLTFHDGKLLALSPRYNTLLVIDPQTAQAVDAFEIEGLASPRSIFVRDGILNVLDRKDGKDYLVEVPLAK
jgi:hypothetical protein